VGTYADLPINPLIHGFLLNEGGLTTIDLAGGAINIIQTIFSGINPAGDIVGTYVNVAPGGIGLVTHGFLLSQ